MPPAKRKSSSARAEGVSDKKAKTSDDGGDQDKADGHPKRKEIKKVLDGTFPDSGDAPASPPGSEGSQSAGKKAAPARGLAEGPEGPDVGALDAGSPSFIRIAVYTKQGVEIQTHTVQEYLEHNTKVQKIIRVGHNIFEALVDKRDRVFADGNKLLDEYRPELRRDRGNDCSWGFVFGLPPDDRFT
jgi:hypothetical protein